LQTNGGIKRRFTGAISAMISLWTGVLEPAASAVVAGSSGRCTTMS
jgi:hypothetical protein